MNDAIVFSFVTAIETHSEFYHRTERSILRGAWDDRFFYQVYTESYVDSQIHFFVYLRATMITNHCICQYYGIL